MLSRSFTKFVLVAAVACLGWNTSARAVVNVLPAPGRVEETQGTFRLTGASGVAGDDERVGRFAAESLGLRWSATNEPAAGVQLKVDPDASLGDEGYDLSVTAGGVTIRAAQPAGLFYGVQTLRQLRSSDGTVPMVHIVDRPRFAYRGVLLDSGRHIQSVAYIKSLIERMAQLKMNRFHWHLTEDQGWRIEIAKYPRLTQVGAWRQRGTQRYGGFYSRDEIREVVDFARSRFVTIVPEIDMPGHSTAAVASYPELGCTQKPVPVRWDWGITPDVLCVGREATYTFCQDVLSDVMEQFPDSPVIHIGGDECPTEHWHACPVCQESMRRSGFTTERQLQGQFTAHLAKFLEAHGRRLQGWNEIMEGADLPRSVIVQQWNSPKSATAAAKAGLDVVSSPTSHAYFDYAYADIWTRKVLEWDPVPMDLPSELRPHILGPQANLWTEHLETATEVDTAAFPRLLAMAEVGWSPVVHKDWPDFRRRAEAWIDRQPSVLQDGLRERLLLFSEPATQP